VIGAVLLVLNLSAAGGGGGGTLSQVRDEAREAVRALHARDIRVVMLTGDNEGTALAVQKQLGLREVQAKLLPEEKVAAVSALMAELRATHGAGPTVAMVGDGINDAPALSRASVGTSVTSRSVPRNHLLSRVGAMVPLWAVICQASRWELGARRRRWRRRTWR
jgi:P-type E1-E2 ATPase